MLNQSRNSFNQSLDGYILQPSIINRPPDPEIVPPMPQKTTVTSESILGMLTGLGSK